MSSLRRLMPGRCWNICVNSRAAFKPNDLARLCVRPIKAALQHACHLPILATPWSFYAYLIVADLFSARENPIQKVDDPALARVSERHRPFMGSASRPMSEEQIAQLLGSLRLWRDKAMILLMLQGGLRPGEVLCLQLSDIEYGRRRVVIRYRNDHPKRARTRVTYRTGG
jgi:site-specific recombinase XerD